MEISQDVRCSFLNADRKRGVEYFKDERVQEILHGDDHASAMVYGSTEDYEVSIYFDDDQVANFECTCPRFEDGYNCKHIWATLLQLESDEKVTAARVSAPRRKKTTKKAVSKSNSNSSSKKTTKKKKKKKKTTTLSDWEQRLRGSSNSLAGGGSFHNLNDCGTEYWYVLTLNKNVNKESPRIEFFERIIRKDGTPGKVKPLAVDPREDRTGTVHDHFLKLVCEYRSALSVQSQWYSRWDDSFESFDSWEISKLSMGAVLPALLATDRIFFRLDVTQSPDDATHVPADNGPPWQFSVDISSDEKAKAWTFRGQLQRGKEVRDLESTVAAFSAGMVVFPDGVAPMEMVCAEGWLNRLRPGPMRVPFKDRDRFLNAMSKAGLLDGTELPTSLTAVDEAAARPVARLRILAQNRNFGGERHADAQALFCYGDVNIRVDSENLVVQDGKKFVQRNIAAERELLEQLPRELVPYRRIFRKDNEPDLQCVRKNLPTILDAVFDTEWEIELEGQPVSSGSSFNIEVTSGIDWFEVEGNCEFPSGPVSLPKILAAAQDGNRFVKLKDGSVGMVPDGWLEKFRGLLDLGIADGDTIRFQKSQALILDAMLSEQKDARADRSFRAFCRKLRSFDGIKPKEAPKSFQGELRDYQKQGLSWLHFLREFGFGGCLADDMGLGKTVQVLALLESRRVRRLKKDEVRKPTLVVVPKSLVFNWIKEAERFSPKLRITNYTGLDRAKKLKQLDQYDVMVTTYGSMRADIVKLADFEFDYVILDESQAIKNSNALAAKATRLLKADHRLAMTGTPIENNVGELWSLFEFLNPGMLGRSSAFKRLSRQNRGIKDDTTRQRLQTLATAIRPYLLRRTKAEVLTDLPDKTEQTLMCDLGRAQRKTYNEIRDYYRAKLLKVAGMQKQKFQILEALLRLRQAACHPGLIDKKHMKVGSAKLDLLLAQIEEVVSEGHKVLVFSQFTSLLALVSDRFDEAEIPFEYLDGKTRKRKEKVERFQTDPDCPVFLISLKAGGSGLNLTAADYVFILDPWWNPAVEAQAVDRAHRIGQAKHVFAYRMIARDTVEERILQLQNNKRELADAIINENGSLISDLTADDLQLLLS